MTSIYRCFGNFTFTARKQTRAENTATQKETFSLTAFELSCNRASSGVRLQFSSLVSGGLIFSTSTFESILHHFTLMIGFHFNYWIYQFHHRFSSFPFNNLRTQITTQMPLCSLSLI